MKKLALLCLLATGCYGNPFDSDPCYTVKIYTMDGTLLDVYEWPNDHPPAPTDAPNGWVQIVIPGCE